MNELTFV